MIVAYVVALAKIVMAVAVYREMYVAFVVDPA